MGLYHDAPCACFKVLSLELPSSPWTTFADGEDSRSDCTFCARFVQSDLNLRHLLHNSYLLVKSASKELKKTRCVCETLMPPKHASSEKHDPDI